MNGIEKITERILSDAQEEIKAVLAEAESEAQRIRTQYQTQAQREGDDLLKGGHSRATEREERLAGAAQLETRKMILAAKQNMLDRAFALAEKKLSQLSNEEYTALLGALAASASHNGKEKVILSKEDRSKCGKAVVAEANRRLKELEKPASLSLSKETREIGGGLLLSSGDIETNCTFETLLRMIRGEIAGDVAAVLFE